MGKLLVESPEQYFVFADEEDALKLFGLLRRAQALEYHYKQGKSAYSFAKNNRVTLRELDEEEIDEAEGLEGLMKLRAEKDAILFKLEELRKKVEGDSKDSSDNT